MRYVVLSFFMLLTLSAIAQGGKEKPAKIYSYAAQMPEPGSELNQYLSKNLHYPDIARAHGTQGKVFLKFVVNEDGSISDCTVLKGIGDGCDEEALRVGKGMPAWKPGMQDGKAVKVYETFPIQFKLQQASTPAPPVQARPVFTNVETAPYAEYSTNSYFKDNLHCAKTRNYVDERSVYVRFIVNEDGHISDCKIIKGMGAGCDDEVIKAVNNMPPWKPGRQDGKPARTYFNFTVPVY